MSSAQFSGANLLTTQAAAELLGVPHRNVKRMVRKDQVPYVRLPGGGLRLPMHALLASLRGRP